MAPFRFLNAKLNTFAVLLPDAVTVTLGVPTLASTVAVGVPKPAAAPAGPCGPVVPVGPGDTDRSIVPSPLWFVVNDPLTSPPCLTVILPFPMPGLSYRSL